MYWQLAESVAAAYVGSDLIFLNLENDQYSCLRSPAGVCLESRQLNGCSLETLQPLITAGLLGVRLSTSRSDDRLPPRRPVADLISLPATNLQVGEICDFLVCWAAALLRFPGRSILALHKQVRCKSRETVDGDMDRVKRRVAVFEALLPWVPFPGACLFRSYLLLRFLHRGGCDALWVIGVRTWPFEAHCWLQLDEFALDDRCERLVRFQPLLAI